MKSIPGATPIVLAAAERAELLVLSPSEKVQHRKRQGVYCVDGSGRSRNARDRRRGRRHDRYGVQVVRALRQSALGWSEGRGRAECGAQIRGCNDTRIQVLLERKSPAGFSKWTQPVLATVLCDVHVQYDWRFLRAQKIDLSGRKSWCVSYEPDFAAVSGFSGASSSRCAICLVNT